MQLYCADRANGERWTTNANGGAPAMGPNCARWCLGDFWAIDSTPENLGKHNLGVSKDQD